MNCTGMYYGIHLQSVLTISTELVSLILSINSIMGFIFFHHTTSVDWALDLPSTAAEGWELHWEKSNLTPSSGTTYSWQSIPSPWVFIRFQHVCPLQKHQIMSNLSDWALPWWGLNKVMNCNWAGPVNEMLAWMNTLGGLEGLTHIGILNHSSFTTCQNSPWLFTTYIACCRIEVPAYHI